MRKANHFPLISLQTINLCLFACLFECFFFLFHLLAIWLTCPQSPHTPACTQGWWLCGSLPRRQTQNIWTNIPLANVLIRLLLLLDWTEEVGSLLVEIFQGGNYVSRTGQGLERGRGGQFENMKRNYRWWNLWDSKDGYDDIKDLPWKVQFSSVGQSCFPSSQAGIRNGREPSPARSHSWTKPT